MERLKKLKTTLKIVELQAYKSNNFLTIRRLRRVQRLCLLKEGGAAGGWGGEGDAGGINRIHAFCGVQIWQKQAVFLPVFDIIFDISLPAMTIAL